MRKVIDTMGDRFSANLLDAPRDHASADAVPTVLLARNRARG